MKKDKKGYLSYYKSMLETEGVNKGRPKKHTLSLVHWKNASPQELAFNKSGVSEREMRRFGSNLNKKKR